MARQADRLVKIGQEGFAAIDEHFGQARWPRPPVMKVPYAHPTYYYVPATEVIDSNEAAQRYKGRIYVDYPKGKPHGIERYTSNMLLKCFEALQGVISPTNFGTVRSSMMSCERRL
ncbi:hypothetical protein POTOM_035275 [Populus tomentosa]|uniref:Uncharacterized protein n=1 Tax=Populus tomentosa TaxID=118781 RepID=A0A8X8CLY8_POPTO|nr:hypothetical protein POTOM_035275 [Populus tomentosa]